MATEAKILTLQISEGYRGASWTTSILCALALAWSAAQFDFKTISLGFVGSVELSRASIPLILVCAIAYTTARLTLEFAMQSVEVRRWHFAQVAFKLSVFLVRATILVLAASGLNRSVETVLYVVLAALGVLVGSGLAFFLATMALLPLLIYIRSRQGRTSIASRVIESSAWAELIVVFTLVALLVVIGVASLQYEPLRSLWTAPPSPLSLGIFVLACIAIVVSMYLQRVWYRKLFANPPNFTEKRLPNGRVGITFCTNPPAVGDWYSQPVNDEQPTKESSRP